MRNTQIKAMKNSAIPFSAGVYKITDLKTGKIYIGSTINLRKRVSGLKSTSYTINGLGKAWSFEVLVLCPNISKEDRLTLEYEYMVLHNSIYPHGLNLRHPVTQKMLISKDKVASKTNYGKKPREFVNVIKY